MSDECQVDLDKLKALLRHARKHCTLDAWSDIAVKYAEGCNAEIERLKAERDQYLEAAEIFRDFGDFRGIISAYGTGEIERARAILTTDPETE